MFENISKFFKKLVKAEQEDNTSKDTAKERLHLVLMQDRANVSADFLELMKQEIIEVIKKYIIVDESAIDVRLTNQPNNDGTTGAPALYANIPIVNIKNEVKAEKMKEKAEENNKGNLENKKNVDDNNKEVEDKIETEETKENTEVENNKEKEDSSNTDNNE